MKCQELPDILGSQHLFVCEQLLYDALLTICADSVVEPCQIDETVGHSLSGVMLK